ncbi:Asp-tRNA(Asn)/Glu-tRNA(Gln) amidotransferase GatCAB subunit B [bacterium]|nr:Asp-tRNA(Asn)/Glu-tRNA(Gln) amidotransferase GatCAB subunit B [bacterium]
MSEYTTTIGIEVHAELTTNSKMFCGCKNDPHAAEANTHVCPVCMAHPGTLPTVNEAAIKKVRLVGEAIGATLTDFSEFDRKNYFYPDIPKAYQISQYAYPLVTGGEIAGVAITRIHLEEDTARSQHDQGAGSLVDFNRAGVPLMELVTEPVVHSAEEAGQFARELQLLLRTLGVSHANMEKGEMRVEANISVSKSDELGTKVEVKNLNSFKTMEAAIAFETKRQIELLESGRDVTQETRGWDEAKSKTFSQRSKESANDYRYFPDPDIPKYEFKNVEEMTSSRLAENMPVLPHQIRNKYRDLGILKEQSEVILQSSRLQPYFWSVVDEMGSGDAEAVRLAANYVSSDVLSLLQQDTEASLSSETVPQYVSLIELLAAGTINSRTAKDLLPEVVFDGIDPEVVAKERGLTQQNSAGSLQPLVEQIITENESVVSDVKTGNEKAIKFLVGQGMKLSKGTANPQLLEQLLKDSIA